MSDTLRLLRVFSLVMALLAAAVAAALAVGRAVGGFEPQSVAVLAAAVLLALVLALRPSLHRLAGDERRLQPDAAGIEISVPVAATSDLERVVAILRRVAADSPHLRADVEVELAEVSGSALRFVLRATVADPGRARTTASDLRLAVVAELRRANLALSHDQIDVHMRDLDGLKAALATVMAERARQTAEKAADRQARAFAGESEPVLKPSNDDA